MLALALFLAVASSTSLLIVPDTQYDVLGNGAREFRNAMRWARECARFHDVEAVLGLGDVTHTQTRKEWLRAAEATAPLYATPGLPAVFARGNHDNGTGYRDYFWRESDGWLVQEHPFLENRSSPFGYYESKRAAVVVLDSYYVADAYFWARAAWQRALLAPPKLAVLVDHATRCDSPLSGCRMVTADQPVPAGVVALAVGGHERAYSQFASAFQPASTGGEILEITLNFQTTDAALSPGKTFGGALGLIAVNETAVTMRTYSPWFGAWVRTSYSEIFWGLGGQPIPLALPSDTIDGDVKCGTHFAASDPLLPAFLGLSALWAVSAFGTLFLLRANSHGIKDL